MRLFILLIIFLPFICPANICAETYELSRTDNGYIFKANIFINADPENALKTIYDFKHLKHFVKRANSVELIRQGSDFQEVCYIYKGFFSNIKSTCRRTLVKKEQTIVFKMIDYEYKGILLPERRSSNGYYKITESGGGCRLEYFEECELGKVKLKWLYFSQVKKGVRKFLNDLKEYVEKTCN